LITLFATHERALAF